MSGGGGGGPESVASVTGSGSPKDSMEAVFSDGASGAGGTPDALLTGVCTSPACNSMARAQIEKLLHVEGMENMPQMKHVQKICSQYCIDCHRDA